MYFVFGSNSSKMTIAVTEVFDPFIYQLQKSDLDIQVKPSYSVDSLKEDGYAAWLHNNELVLLNENPVQTNQKIDLIVVLIVPLD